MHRSQLPVTAPCPLRWEDLPGEGATRRCPTCERDVHDLSALSRWRARLRLRRAGPTPCVRYASRADGTLVFRPSRVARGLAALLALAPPPAAAAEVTILSWVAVAREALVPPDPGGGRSLDFGGVTNGPAVDPPVVRDLHGPAAVDVITAPGTWAEVRVRCEGADEEARAALVDGRVTVRSLPEGAACEVRLTGGAPAARIGFEAGVTEGRVQVPVRPKPPRR